MAGNSRAVFLSYASQDAQAAQRISEAQRAAGIEVWFDQSELRGGDAWDHRIREQIHACRLFIPVISANSEHRDEGYFRREWNLAADRTRDMAQKRAFLIPVVIDDTSERGASVQEEFHELQWTRFPGGEAPAAFVERIRRLLSNEAPSAPEWGGTPAGAGTSVPAGPAMNTGASDAGNLLSRGDTAPPPRPFHEQVGIAIGWGVLLLCVGGAFLIMRSATHLTAGVAVSNAPSYDRCNRSGIDLRCPGSPI